MIPQTIYLEYMMRISGQKISQIHQEQGGCNTSNHIKFGRCDISNQELEGFDTSNRQLRWDMVLQSRNRELTLLQISTLNGVIFQITNCSDVMS